MLLPGTRKVLIGATFLALGRALGETMAVLMVSGNALNMLPNNIYAPVSTMAAFIVSQLDSALQDPSGMAVRSLAEIALVLSVISIIINALARVAADPLRSAARPARETAGKRNPDGLPVESASVLRVPTIHALASAGPAESYRRRLGADRACAPAADRVDAVHSRHGAGEGLQRAHRRRCSSP